VPLKKTKKKKVAEGLLFSQQSTFLANQIIQQMNHEKTAATSSGRRNSNCRLSLLEKVI